MIPKYIGSAILQGLGEAKQAGNDIDEEIMALAAQQRDDITWREAQCARLEAERERAFEEFEDDYFDE